MKLLHITAGLIAIGAGAVALYALKGARLHRESGMISGAGAPTSA
jgi:uncharacterized membrane protein